MDTISPLILVPWSEDQVRSLNEYQVSGVFHPFTCGRCRDHLGIQDPDGSYNDRLLVATTDGWICPTCDYTQNWAHEGMADGSWREAKRALDKALGRDDDARESS